jgi:hypothetical protein
MSTCLSGRWVLVFATELAGTPAMPLRGGDAFYEYRQAPVYDAALDRVTDAYLDRYCAGLPPGRRRRCHGNSSWWGTGSKASFTTITSCGDL